MRKHSLALVSISFILFTRVVLLAQEKPEWVALDGVSRPGTPIEALVSKVSNEGTTFDITVPGLWMESISYGGKTFTRLTFPAVQLKGIGFPNKAGEPGWYDFPPEAGQVLMPTGRFANALQIGIPKPVFPFNALDQKPQSGAEMERLGIEPSGARPGIPALRGFLAVSAANTEKGDLTLDIRIDEAKTLQLSAPLAPAGFEGSDQVKTGEGYIPPELIDDEFYSKFRGAYRGVEASLSSISRVGSFSALQARIPLVELNSAQIIRVFPKLTILVKHLKGTEDFTCPFSWDSWLFNLPFINGAALRAALTAKGLKIEASRSAHYLILTPREYRDELNEFALWKQSKGLNVDFAYVGPGGTNDVAADRNALDAYIENYFHKNYCHGVYVLLVGDVDVIPSGRSARIDSDPDGADADSDHIYEVLGSDRFPSLYVGRLSVNSASELTTQLGKILSYERSPVAGDWPTRATLAANSQNDDGTTFVSPSFPSKYAAAVNAVAAYGGYSSPPSFQVLHAGAANAAVVRARNQDVVDAITAGRGIVLYRGHGSGSAWVSGWDRDGSSFTSATHVNNLVNTAFPIVFSIACQNARLRNNDSIAELWMNRAGGGAVAHFGASVNSYTTENHERAKGLFRAIYESGFTRLGPALAEGERISYNVTGGGSGWDNNTFCYNLLGDPELTIRRRTVLRFDLIASLATINAQTLIKVSDAQGVVAPGSFVNVTLADGRRVNGFADGRGELALSGIGLGQIAALDLQADGYKASRMVIPPTKREWMAFDLNAKPGTPISASILKVDQASTSLRLHIPGVWVISRFYGGRPVSQIEFPSLDQLVGAGLPQKEGERGWYDFPAETGLALLSSARYAHPFEQGVFQPVFPMKAVGKHPRTGTEMEQLGIDPAGARPGIPTLRGFVAVSRENTPNDLSIDFADSKRRELVLPAPLRPAGFTGSDQTAEPFGYDAPELYDEEFYSNFKGAYTGSENPILSSGSVGAFGAAAITIPLAEYVRGDLINIFTDLVVNVKHLKGTEDFSCPFSWDSWLFNLPFINGAALRDALTAKGLKIEASRSAHYLILTPREYRDELNEFALWKQSKGLNVDFAYVGAGVGNDVAADRNALDAYIEDYFRKNYCHGVYVLLVGDVDVIPSGRTARIDSDPDGADADSDHIYEVLGSDRFPSLYVGRLSVNSASELTTQLGKILSYERSPAAGDWPTRATLAANSQNDDGTTFVSASFPSKYAAAVNAIAAYGGYSSPPSFQVLHAGAASAAVVRARNQDVVDAITAGRGIVLYRGHGSSSTWASGWDRDGSSFTSATHVNNLVNTAFPIVFSIACQNARLRNDDSIAELWMNRVGGGAVAHFGASVNSYTTENHERAKGLFRAIYESGFTRLGPALAEGERISYNVTGGGSGWDNNTFCYNLLGDPELTIRRKSVPFKLVLIPGFFQIGGRSLLMVKDSDGRPVDGALVNMVLGDKRHAALFTRPDGTLELPNLKLEEIMAIQIHADGYPFSETDLTAPPTVVLQALGFGRAGEFNVQVNGGDASWRVQGSEDLVRWDTIGTVEGSGFRFSDPNGGSLKYRFYRAVRSN